MKFCSSCAEPVVLMIPPGDDRERFVCPACGAIHYQNPRIIVGSLVTYREQILLCKRAIEPRAGLWTLPAGFMENGESAEDGAMRETWEEARAKPILRHLHTVYSIPHINQVYLLYRAELEEPVFGAGPESLEVKLFSRDEIPWNDLAFHSIAFSLKRFVKSPDAEQAWIGQSDFKPRRVG